MEEEIQRRLTELSATHKGTDLDYESPDEGFNKVMKGYSLETGTVAGDGRGDPAGRAGCRNAKVSDPFER